MKSGLSFQEFDLERSLFEELLNEDEIQSEHVFPKIYVGKAKPIGKVEMNFVLEKLFDMTDEEMKETFVGLANRKLSEEKKKATTV